MRMLCAAALAVVLCAGHAEAQSGTIVYGWVASLDVEASGEMAAVRRVFEAGGRAPFVLHFTPTESLMVKDRPVEEGTELSPSTFSMKEFSPSAFRLNHANLNVLVEILDAWFATEANVLTEAYVGEDGSGIKVLASLNGGPQRVETEVARVEWRITGEQREHMGYPVTVAVGEMGGAAVEAWFAPDIPVSGGPAAYGGLPGMILMLSLDGGRTTYAATEISLDGVEDGLIRMPEGGEVRSEESYRSFVAGQVRRFGQDLRGNVRRYGNMECTVGVHTEAGLAALQCQPARLGS